MKRCLYTLLLTLPFVVLVHLHSASALAASASPTSFTISDLGTLGGTESFAYAINDRGDVVGLARMGSDLATHSFFYRRGTLTDLYPLNSGEILTGGPMGINNKGQIASGVVGSDGIYYPAIYDADTGITVLGSLGVPWYGFSGVATSLNNRGQAVGYSYVDGVTRHAFLYSDGVMTDLGSAGGYSAALRINDSGQAVGFTSDTSYGFARAFVYHKGALTIIDPFDGPSIESYASGINNSGQVVGQGLTSEGYFNAFIYSDGTSKSLGTLSGGHNSAAFSINDRGLVVGIADYPYQTVCRDPYTYLYVPCIKYAQHGFLYDHGVMTDLNSMIPADAGWDLEWAVDINNRGQITGYGRLNGVYRAYVLSPCEARGNGRGEGKGRCRGSASGR
jgi:probable HAF family extracellular repeat protein